MTFNLNHNRRNEHIVYLCAWLIVIAVSVLDLMRRHATDAGPALTEASLTRLALGLLPFVILFIINNYLLIPRLLLRNRMITYIALAIILISMVEVYGYLNFRHWLTSVPARFPRHNGGHPMPPMFHFPFFIDLSYAMLVVGINTSIALIYQRYNDKLLHESTMKADAENQLAYLKAQINPHFYMNMLNNIHAMIEIDPEKAQEMVIDMSKLMRYTLYDSSHRLIALNREIDFVRNYIRLMSERFPAEKLAITTDFPDAEATADIAIPPLLFLVFIENAFKHGVSYREQSFVEIKLSLTGKLIRFTCRNSVAPASRSNEHRRGIGLANIKQRLNLLYGKNARLVIEPAGKIYTVILEIPQNTAR